MTAFAPIARHGLLPVVACLETPAQAVSLARAYLAAGLEVMEIPLRHPAALDCLRAVTGEVPGMTCGAGTIIDQAQVKAVLEAGAAFGVSPGFHPAIVQAAREEHLPFAPGIATPGELEQALALGCTHAKLFPVTPLGGPAYLKALADPYRHTGVRLIPMGGITLEQIPDYLGNPLVDAVGLSALSPRELVHAERWEDLSTLAREALARRPLP